MIISVTQDDIDNGVKGDCKDCAVARAAQRNFQFKRVEIFDSYLWIFRKVFHKNSDSTFEVDKTLELPNHVNDWIYKFDTDQEVKPFEFEIDA